MLRRGYDLDEVDDFVDLVLVRLDAPNNKAALNNDNEAIELTVEDVRAAGFKPRRGGYAEHAVDETLDRVVEVLLVQRRAVDGSLTGQAQEPDVEAAGPAM